MSAPPNILVLVADDHSAETLASSGSAVSKVSRTPAIESLARQGCTLRQCFVTLSLCTPSRLSMLTGRYAHEHLGVNLNDGNKRRLETYSKALERAGYRTGLFGKWHIASRPPFQNFSVFWKQGSYFEPLTIRENEWASFHQKKDTAERNAGKWAAQIVQEETLAFLKAAQGPWLIHAHFKETHETWQYPPRFEVEVAAPIPDTLFLTKSTSKRLHDGWPLLTLGDRMAQHGIYGNGAKFDIEHVLRQENLVCDTNATTTVSSALSCDDSFSEKRRRLLLRRIFERYIGDYSKAAAAMDDAIGNILNFVDMNGYRENTVVIYTSDNGMFLGDHGYFDKRFAYEASARVPCIVRYPREIRAGTYLDNLVTNVDWAPTFLDFAELSTFRVRSRTVSPKLRGISIRPYFAKDNKRRARDAIYYRYYAQGPLRPSPQRPSHFAVRTNDKKKLIFFDGLLCTQNPPFELYDLATDPQETKNIYDENNKSATPLLDGLRLALNDAMRTAGDTLRGLVSGDHLPASPLCETLTDDCLRLIASLQYHMRNATSISDVPGPYTKCRPDLLASSSSSSSQRSDDLLKEPPPPPRSHLHYSSHHHHRGGVVVPKKERSSLGDND